MLLFLSILDIFQITSLTQPGKIDANFLSEVFSYMIQRLILVPLPPSSPVLIQNLTEVHVFRTNAMNWLLILTLHQNSNGKKNAGLDSQEDLLWLWTYRTKNLFLICICTSFTQRLFLDELLGQIGPQEEKICFCQINDI